MEHERQRDLQKKAFEEQVGSKFLVLRRFFFWRLAEFDVSIALERYRIGKLGPLEQSADLITTLRYCR